jgi:hypothetical protein
MHITDLVKAIYQNFSGDFQWHDGFLWKWSAFCSLHQNLGREEEFERSEVGGREVHTRMRAGATMTEEVKPAEKFDRHGRGKTKREKHEEDKDGKELVLVYKYRCSFAPSPPFFVFFVCMFFSSLDFCLQLLGGVDIGLLCRIVFNSTENAM